MVKPPTTSTSKANSHGKQEGSKKSFSDMNSAPRRPLSAYNLFFRKERENVKAEIKAGMRREDFILSFDAALKRLQGKHKPAEFQAIATTVATRWKKLGHDERVVYEKLAQQEMVQYKDLKLQYQRKIERECQQAARKNMVTTATTAGPMLSSTTIEAGLDASASGLASSLCGNNRAVLLPSSPPFGSMPQGLASALMVQGNSLSSSVVNNTHTQGFVLQQGNRPIALPPAAVLPSPSSSGGGNNHKLCTNLAISDPVASAHETQVTLLALWLQQERINERDKVIQELVVETQKLQQQDKQREQLEFLSRQLAAKQQQQLHPSSASSMTLLRDDLLGVLSSSSAFATIPTTPTPPQVGVHFGHHQQQDFNRKDQADTLAALLMLRARHQDDAVAESSLRHYPRQGI